MATSRTRKEVADAEAADEYNRWFNIILNREATPTMPTPSLDDIARVSGLIADDNSHSLRFTIAAATFHALIAGRAGQATGPHAAAIASQAYELADAFLSETASRLLPRG